VFHKINTRNRNENRWYLPTVIIESMKQKSIVSNIFIWDYHNNGLDRLDTYRTFVLKRSQNHTQESREIDVRIHWEKCHSVSNIINMQTTSEPCQLKVRWDTNLFCSRDLLSSSFECDCKQSNVSINSVHGFMFRILFFMVTSMESHVKTALVHVDINLFSDYHEGYVIGSYFNVGFRIVMISTG
jgi:hypothetical protein